MDSKSDLTVAHTHRACMLLSRRHSDSIKHASRRDDLVSQTGGSASIGRREWMSTRPSRCRLGVQSRYDPQDDCCMLEPASLPSLTMASDHAVPTQVFCLPAAHGGCKWRAASCSGSFTLAWCRPFSCSMLWPRASCSALLTRRSGDFLLSPRSGCRGGLEAIFRRAVCN